MQSVNDGFLPWLKKTIPLAEHLGIQALDWQGQQLVFNLSLAPLVNDKGTGFGGGVAGLATLLGWCYVTLLLDKTQQRCPVVVKDANNAFTAPITDDFTMRCEPLNAKDLEVFFKEFATKGRARLKLKVWVMQQEAVAFSYQGTYVALGHA